jgi:hypothetical protein
MIYDSENFDLIDILKSKDVIDSSWPLWWTVKNNNLIVTRGKTGTRSLKEISNYSSEDTTVPFKNIEDLINNKNYCLHFVIRNPIDRFKSGILEDWYVNVWPMIRNLNVEEKINWDATVDQYVKYRIASTLNSNARSQFHIGNWLEDVETLITYFNNSIHKVWDFNNIKELIEYLGEDPKINVNDSRYKERSFRELFVNAFDNLSDSTKKLINQYLHREIQIYNRLIELREQI